MIICLLCCKEKHRNNVEVCKSCLDTMEREEYLPLVQEYRQYAIFCNSQFVSRIKNNLNTADLFDAITLK